MNFRLSIALLTVGCVAGTLSAAALNSFRPTSSDSGSTQYAQGVSIQHDGSSLFEALPSEPIPVTAQQAIPEPDIWVPAVIGIGLILASTLMRRKTSNAYKRIERG